MKKLLLCTFVLIWGSCFSAQISKIESSKTPILDALNQKRNELQTKKWSIPFYYSDAAKEESDEEIKNLKKQKKLEIEKNQLMQSLNKEIEEIKKKLKEMYPEKYKDIKKWEDGIIEISGKKISKEGEASFFFSSLPEEEYSFTDFFGTSPLVTQLTTKIKERKNLIDSLNKSDKIKELDKKIEKRASELAIEARDEKYPEIKNVEIELEKIDKKLAQINEGPEVKELNKKNEELYKKKSLEVKKIQKQFQVEKENISQQAEAESKKKLKEFFKTNPDTKSFFDKVKSFVKQLKEIIKNKYPEEFKKIETLDLDVTSIDSFFEEIFGGKSGPAVSVLNKLEEICKKLSSIDPEIKKLDLQMELASKDVQSRVEPQISDFMRNEGQKMFNYVTKKRQELSYKLNPEIEKIDKKITSLQEQLNAAKEKALVEINKREAVQK